MSIIATLPARCWHFLRNLFRRDQVERELRDELNGYLDMLIDQKRAEGLSPRAAKRAARLQFGNIDCVREHVRDVRYGAWIDQAARDVKFGTRRLCRSPTFALASGLTLALVIGANASIFALVERVLLNPLPYPSSDRLIVLEHGAVLGGEARAGARAAPVTRPRRADGAAVA